MIRFACMVPGIIFLALASAPAFGDAHAGQSAIIEVRLPADAALLIDGRSTSSTGAERQFQTPALPSGKEFNYTLKAVWREKQVVRSIKVQAGAVTRVAFAPEEFLPAAAVENPKPEVKKEEPVVAAKVLPPRAGFVPVHQKDRWWVFRDGSKELSQFRKEGAPDKHVTRINAAPFMATIKAPDIETLEEYLTAKPGFVTKYASGRLWVFKSPSKELSEFLKHGDLEKRITRINAGPRGMTVMAPDAEILNAYLKAE